MQSHPGHQGGTAHVTRVLDYLIGEKLVSLADAWRGPQEDVFAGTATFPGGDLAHVQRIRDSWLRRKPAASEKSKAPQAPIS